MVIWTDFFHSVSNINSNTFSEITFLWNHVAKVMDVRNKVLTYTMWLVNAKTPIQFLYTGNM